MPSKNQLKERCNGEICAKFAHKCIEISDEERQNILQDYYGQGNLQLQRQYIVRYVYKKSTGRKTSGKEESRRKFTFCYTLPKGNANISVCKKLFLNTLSISERVVRTALSKVKETGVLESEKRGGRSDKLKLKDAELHNLISVHIKIGILEWSHTIAVHLRAKNIYILN